MAYKYKRLKLPNGKLIDEHRLIMQGMLLRKLESDEVVHHKDGDKMNNAPCNLEVMTLSEHSRMHAKEGNWHERLDGKAHRFKKGYRPTNRSLTDWEAYGIKQILASRGKESIRSIARALGISRDTLGDISAGRSYTDI